MVKSSNILAYDSIQIMFENNSEKYIKNILIKIFFFNYYH